MGRAPHKPRWRGALVLCLAPALLVVSACTSAPGSLDTPPSTPVGSPQSLPQTASFVSNGTTVRLSVASSPNEQQQGLMFVDSLPADQGMLFLFDPERTVSFWMKNTQIPLDIVFLRDGVVTNIAADAQPCTSTLCPTYRSTGPVDEVVELAAGSAAQLRIRAGSTIRIRHSPTLGPA